MISIVIHQTQGLNRPCTSHDLFQVSEGLQCGNCLALSGVPNKAKATASTLTELGFVNFHANRWRVTEWPTGKWLAEFRADWTGQNWNIEAANLLGICADQNAAMLREVIRRAKAQGFDAWLCDNDPKHGGSIL